MAAIFPRFTPTSIEALTHLLDILSEDPDALDSPECPYDQKLVTLIKTLQTAGTLRTLGENNENKLNELDFENLNVADEASQLYLDIKKMVGSLKQADTNEKVQLYRLATSQLDKLLQIKERAEGVEQFSAFKQLFLDSIDRYLDPKQKTELFDNIKEVVGA